jgi:phosphopantothenoylcysteine decarboxylase/phosphopantothenate--cysteine ligase
MRVALGVCGGVAAYKAAELVRRLQQAGWEVEVVLTRGAEQFISPLTFAALTGHRVITGLFDADGPAANITSAIEHVAVAQRIDLLLVAPATAHVLAKMAAGLADDFLTTLYLATRAPVVVAPAMNVHMWTHPATQAAVARLRERGVVVVEPDEGYLACGMTGPGRLASLEAILDAVRQAVQPRADLVGETVLVTAGPTCEDIDPVRFIGNRSSGRMGYALAEAAQRRGARVILISGPVALTPPVGVETFSVRSAEDMYRAVLDRLEQATVVIMAAAVADYRPVQREPQKIKRGAPRLVLELEPTPDILAAISRQKGERILVGFAAETERLREHAWRKLQAKQLDLLVGNDVTRPGAGFDVDTNEAVLFFADGREMALPLLSKRELADRILDALLELRQQRGQGRSDVGKT